MKRGHGSHHLWPPWRHDCGQAQSRQRHGFRQGLRHYYGAHLHRRMFLWFGITIAVTMGVMWGLLRLTAPHVDGRPPRLLFLGAAAITLWIITGKIAHRLSRPLGELVGVADEIGRGNLAARARQSFAGVDEIATLGRSMNEMAARIQRQLAAERELLATVSHELRTPLARLRVLLEIARERGVQPDTWDEHERELLEMDRLVGELLASARLEFQALTARPLEAGEVARRALERAGLATDGILHMQSGTPLPFRGDPTLLGRALANLIDNARKHGGALVRLSVKGRSDSVVFEVDDSGPGFPPGFESRAFAPFVSGGERVASTDAAETSLGLGLALVSRIARAHGGSVTASNRQEGGAHLVLEVAREPPTRAPRAVAEDMAD